MFERMAIWALAALLVGAVAPAFAADPHAGHQHGATTARVPADASVPPLAIVMPENGAVVGSQLAVIFQTPADMAVMTMGSSGKVGTHLHIDTEGVSLMPTMKQLIRLGNDRYLFVFDLPARPGKKTLRVYWSDAQHRTVESSMSKVTVQVRAD